MTIFYVTAQIRGTARIEVDADTPEEAINDDWGLNSKPRQMTDLLQQRRLSNALAKRLR